MRTKAAVCALLGVLFLGPLAGKGAAGVYSASECASWNTQSAAQPGEFGHHFFGLSRDCSPGQSGLSISFPQAYWAWGYANWTVSAPAGTHIVNLSGAQQGVNADNWFVALHACTPTDCGPNVYVSGDGFWRTFGTPPGNYSSWSLQLTCGAATCFGSPSAGAHVRDVTMTMSDDSPPTVSAAGAVLSGRVQRGRGGVDVASADLGAGLGSAWALVNDQAVAQRSFACSGAPMQPCPSSSPGVRLGLDTQAPPFHNGSNTVQACVADYGAPPNITCTAKHLVKVDNSCAPSSVPGGSRLHAVFRRNHRRTVRVKAGQGVRLIGKLTDAAGHAVAGATLCTSEAVAGNHMAAVGTVRTNARGRFRFRVSPGPNRRLRIGYRYDRDQLVRRARFESELRPRLRLFPQHRTANGDRLRLFGSIPGPRKRGRIVILQASTVGSGRWLTFRKARTDRHGAFKARYRFSSTDTTTEYRFRATVPPQNGYPYEGGRSRSQTITVLGR